VYYFINYDDLNKVLLSTNFSCFYLFTMLR